MTSDRPRYSGQWRITVPVVESTDGGETVGEATIEETITVRWWRAHGHYLILFHETGRSQVRGTNSIGKYLRRHHARPLDGQPPLHPPPVDAPPVDDPPVDDPPEAA